MTSLTLRGDGSGLGAGLTGPGRDAGSLCMARVGHGAAASARVAQAVRAGVTRFNHGDFAGAFDVYRQCCTDLGSELTGAPLRAMERARSGAADATSPLGAWIRVFCGFVEDVIDSPRRPKAELEPGEVAPQDSAKACWHKVREILSRGKTPKSSCESGGGRRDPGLALELLRRYLAGFITRKHGRAPFKPGLVRDAIVHSRGTFGVDHTSMDCARAWVLYFCLERIRGGGAPAPAPGLLVPGDRVVATRGSTIYNYVGGWRGEIVSVRPTLAVRWDCKTVETHVDFSDIEKECERPKSLRRKQFEARRRKVKLKQRIAKEAKKRDLRSGEKVHGMPPRGVSVLRQVNLQLLERMQRGY